MNKHIKAQNSYSNRFVRSTSHIYKNVVNFYLTVMFKPKYIVILTGLFCSVVTSSISHFYSFFSVNNLAGGEILV